MSNSNDHTGPKLPGYGKPLRFRLEPDNSSPRPRYFPIAIFEEHSGPLVTAREYTIMDMVNTITDKPDWERKVFDDAIIAKWKQEFLSNGSIESVGSPGADGDGASPKNSQGDHDDEDDGNESQSGSEGAAPSLTNNMSDGDSTEAWSVNFDDTVEISEKMVDWAINEAKYKAELSKKIQCVEALDGVWKSDVIVGEDLKLELREAVKSLEDVPEKDKDWHPGSNGQVLDIVHPSIYPLVYGQSQILEDGVCGVNDCTSWIGKGKDLTLPPEDVRENPSDVTFSQTFQWLPSEFELPKDSDEVITRSYINNVHPRHHPKLYAIIPKFVAKALPLWDRVLSCVDFEEIPPRVNDWSNSDGYGFDKEHSEEHQPPYPDNDDYDAWEAELEAWKEERTIVPPEPQEFKTPKERLLAGKKGPWSNDIIKSDRDPPDTHPAINLRSDFGRLQIIVKLANIHLTPEKPQYPGGSWHVEGQGNEAICATALYYYDSQNTTDSYLNFRQQVGDEIDLPYPQGDFDAVEAIYNFQNEDPTVHQLGAVNTREGRLLAFPNGMQHRVMPFSLADKSKPGHRKILALFLVDPNLPIISTANVPPQQHAWWQELVEEAGVFERLPLELAQQVLRSSDFPVSLEKAKEQREELMKERRVFVKKHNEEFLVRNTFNLCEH